MALDYSGSPQAFQNNINKKQTMGTPGPQARAIAYNIARHAPRQIPQQRFKKLSDHIRNRKKK